MADDRRLWIPLGERRQHHASTASWLKDAYAGFCKRFPNLPLPMRGCTLALHLRETKYPLYVRNSGSDRWIASEVLMAGEYAAAADTAAPPVAFILDLGTNIGTSIRYWQERFPGCRILSVEPDADNLRVAAMNVGCGPAPGNVRLLQGFVAATPGEVPVERQGREAGWYRMGDPQAGQPTVRKLTVPQVLEQSGEAETVIDLLKCDIEGAEAEVFANCGQWIRRVRSFVVEVHAPYTAEKFIADISAAGCAVASSVVEDKGSGLALIWGRVVPGRAFC
jgi:FkbM family methyltransferase